MSLSYKGGIISSTGAVSNGANLTDTAPGVWKLSDAGYLVQTNAWPGTALRDPFYNNVTALINGNSINGAQNNTFLDSSSNNFTITRNGNTNQGSLSPYQNHWSNYFDGSSYMYSTDPQIVPATGDFTVEAWINIYNVPSVPATIFTQGNTGSNYLQIFVGGYGDNVAIEIKFGSNTYYPTGPVLINSWNHIAFQRTGSTVTGYLNGYAYLTATDSTSIASTPGPRIGASPNADQYFNGYISNVRVSNIIRYPAPFTPPAAPFVSDANTMLLTCQANRFIDSSSYNHVISLDGNNVVSRFTGTQLPQQYNTGNYGGSAYFDGSGDYLTLAANSAWSLPGDFTWECWAYPTSASADARILHQGSAGTQKMIFYMTSGAGFNFYYDGGSNFIASSIGLKLNAWNHIAGVRNGSTITIYINGVSGGTATSSATLGDSSLGFAIGSNGGGLDPFPGYVSDARIVKGTAVYTAAFTPPTAPLTAVSGTQLLTNFTNAGIVDSTTLRTLETVGNAQVSTSVKKFGSGSLSFDGSGDYLCDYSPATINLTNFGYRDFTIECWIYFNSTSGNQGIMDNASNISAAGTSKWVLWKDSSGNLIFGQHSVGTIMSYGWSPSTGVWYHVAVTKVSSSSNSWKMFVDGQTVATSTAGGNTFFSSGGLQVGIGASFSSLNGYLDDVRITRGIARYKQNFAVPVAPFPTY